MADYQLAFEKVQGRVKAVFMVNCEQTNHVCWAYPNSKELKRLDRIRKGLGGKIMIDNFNMTQD